MTVVARPLLVNPPLALSVSPTTLNKTFAAGVGGTTSASTGTPSGGAGGYTYSWTYVSGDSFTIDTPTAASTTFSFNTSTVATYSGTYRLTITDGMGATTNQTITVTFDVV